jgi:predicted alpha/beta hydrolase family esterase
MKQITFIQGRGSGGYQADARLVRSLQAELGAEYKIHYPQLQTDESLPDFGWLKQIGEAIDGASVLVAHSLGGSLLLKYLAKNKVNQPISGIFLLATPFWGGNEAWVQGLKLREDFADHLPHVAIFFYYCKDDAEIPVGQMKSYQKKLPGAVFREIESGGHQFKGRLGQVARDIRSV